MAHVTIHMLVEVTAVLVEGALANAANDKELSRHDMKQTATRMYVCIHSSH